MSAARHLRTAMITSLRPRCGIADYSRMLVDELARHVDVAWIAAPDAFAPVMNEADVVHIQHQYFLFGGVAPWKNTFCRLADQITAPVVVTVHEFVPPSGNMVKRMAISSTNRAQFGHPAIRAFIVHTEADRQSLISCGVAPDRIECVPHPVPPRPYMPPRSEARRKLRLDDRFVVTIFGFLSRRKGHLIAIGALRHLPSNVHLILAGGKHPDDRTGYVDELRAAVAQAGVGDRATITGYLEPDEAAAIMSATDLVLAPFMTGSGSGSMAYAFSCGKPIVASAIAANVEIHRRCPEALALVNDVSPIELAKAVAQLQHDAAALARLAEGSARYATLFPYSRMAEDTVRIYERIAKRSQR